MTSALAGFVAAALGFWFVVSLLAQARSRSIARLKRRDYCALIPAWTFFAPNPGTSDYHLFFRDRLAGGTLSLWREVPVERSGSVLRGVWNPGKRDAKAFVDYVGEIRSLARDYPARNLQLTLAYQALSGRALTEPATVGAEARQFAVMETRGHYDGDAPRLVFLGGFHHLPELE